jgi:hypothetical protein
MRNAYKIFLAVIFSMIIWSCSEDLMDVINRDVNDPTQVESRLVITDAMTSTAFSIIGSDLAFYASIYMELNTGIWNQAYNADIRSGEPISSTTYNNNWVTMYNTLYNLKVIREKCSTGGEEEGNYHTLGIAQVLSALILATLTDVMGDVPWTEALQPGIIFTPVLDKQEDIYTAVFGFLDDGIANLDKESVFPELGDQDLIYGGDVSLWKKFAYGLKARYTMRLSFRTPDYSDVISFADQSFASPSEQAEFLYNGATTVSPFYRFFIDRDYFGASQSLHDKLVARNDPRDTIFWKPHPEASTEDIVFAPNGTADQVQGKYSISAISTPTAPTYLMSYHELEFLKAEAYARMNQLPEAEDALRNAISAAFRKVNIGLTDAEATDYFDNEVQTNFNANPLSEIMNQKYIAFYEEEALEAYNDYRRLVAMGDNVINLENPKNPAQFPWRFTYGSADVTTNVNVRQAYGDGNYVYTEKVWWAGGTR